MLSSPTRSNVVESQRIDCVYRPPSRMELARTVRVCSGNEESVQLPRPIKKLRALRIFTVAAGEVRRL